MDSGQLKDILTKHKAWLNGENDGVRAVLIDANLSDANLSNANLSNANLRGAVLRGAVLIDANLSNANLSGAVLRGAVLIDANLSNANLIDANLSNANLSGAVLRGAVLIDANLSNANLSNANLRGAVLIDANLSNANLSGAVLIDANLRGAVLIDANLSNADLRGAVLSNANLNNISFNSNTVGFILACPEIGSFIGFKKASGYIVVLEIPADAQRSSATSLKCRCNKAKVLRIENLDGSISKKKSIPSNYDENFIYKVGVIVQVENFDTDRWNECSRGIHFFLSRELAVQYT